MLTLQSGVYIFLLPIFRKARLSFFRVLHTIMWDLEEGRPCQASEILVKKYIYIPDCKISLASFVLFFPACVALHAKGPFASLSS